MVEFFAFSVSFLERVKLLGSLSVSACDYLTLRAEFTMPPRTKALFTLTNLGVEQKQSAAESHNFQRRLRGNFLIPVLFSAPCVIVSRWLFVTVVFGRSVLA